MFQFEICLCGCKDLNFVSLSQARKALRALRSLVKLQALVRGYLVRKQTATTLQRLQALMRLQASSHALKNLSSRKSSEQVRVFRHFHGMNQRRFVEDGTEISELSC
jgi:myosin heavy subunit